MKPTILAGSANTYLAEAVAAKSASAEKYLLELLLLADAACRAGAARLTAVIPYFGCARQDRRASG